MSHITTHPGWFYASLKVEKHEILKREILRLVDELPTNNNHFWDIKADKIDWVRSAEFSSRAWLQKAVPALQGGLNSFLRSLHKDEAYSTTAAIENIWFQQYIEGNYHNWHIHGGTFVMVYYVELPEDAPRTEFLHPFNKELDSVQLNELEEGDLLIFPSYVTHRAPQILHGGGRKTIISANFSINQR